jgi:hypothetical protein
MREMLHHATRSRLAQRPEHRRSDLDGWTPRRLRHSVLTRDAEDGTSPPMCWPAPATPRSALRSGTPAPASTRSPGTSPNVAPLHLAAHTPERIRASRSSRCPFDAYPGPPPMAEGSPFSHPGQACTRFTRDARARARGEFSPGHSSSSVNERKRPRAAAWAGRTRACRHGDATVDHARTRRRWSPYAGKSYVDAGRVRRRCPLSRAATSVEWRHEQARRRACHARRGI